MNSKIHLIIVYGDNVYDLHSIEGECHKTITSEKVTCEICIKILANRSKLKEIVYNIMLQDRLQSDKVVDGVFKDINALEVGKE